MKSVNVTRKKSVVDPVRGIRNHLPRFRNRFAAKFSKIL